MTRDNWLGNLLSVVAVAVSVLTAVFAWENNRINERAVTANIAVLRSTFTAGLGSASEQNNARVLQYCQFEILAANLGGGETSIIDYEGHMEFGGQTVNLFRTDWQSRILTPETPKTPVFNLAIYDANAHLVPKEAVWKDTSKDLEANYMSTALQLPMKVVANSTFEFKAWARFAYDSQKLMEQVFPFIGMKPDQSKDRPVRFGFTLHTLAGQTAEVSPTDCIWLRPK